MSRTPSQKKRPAVLATSVAALLSLGLLLSAPQAMADLYWDGSAPGTNVSGGSGGAGTWDNGTPNWSNDGSGSAASDQAYDSSQLAIFATSGATVSLGDNITFTSLKFTANGYTIDGSAGPFTLTTSGAGQIYATTGVTVTIGAQIIDPNTGPNGLSLQGDDATATITLTNSNNSYSGGTTIGSGAVGPTVVIDSDGELGQIAGTLTFNGGILQTTANVISGRGVLLTGGATFQPNGGTTLELDGGINGVGVLTMSGGGTLKLTNAGNTYSGGTDITAGTVVISADGNLGGAGDIITFGGGTLESTANVTTSRPVSLNPGGGILLPDSATTLELDGAITGTGSLTMNGAGTLLLTNPGNSYTGLTAITNGTLRAGAVNVIPSASPVTVGPGATFDLNGNSQNVASIAGGGSITLGAGTLTTGSAGSSFSGVISGTGGLTKAGGATLTLTGANTYTGATTANGGILLIDPTANPSGVLSSSSALVVGGGQFQFNGLATPTTQVLNGLTVNSGASVVAVDVTTPGVITTLDLRGTGGTLGITRNANGFVDFNAIGGTLGVDAIILTAQANNSSGIIGTWATVNGGSAFAMTNSSDEIVAYNGYTDINALGPNQIQDGPDTNVRIVAMGTSGPVPIAQALTRINSLTQDFTTASTIDTSPGELRLGVTGGLFITPGNASLTIGTAPNSGVLSAGEDTQTVPSQITLENNSGNGSLLTINSVIADNGAAPVSVQVDGTGTTVFAGTNTYSGSTSIFNGTLQTATNNVIPLKSAVLVDTSGTLDLNNTLQSVGSIADGPTGGGTITLGSGTLTTGNDNTSTTFSGVIQGVGGNLTKVGTGTLTLAGASTYTGATTVSAGTLNLTGSLTGSNVSTTGSGNISESAAGVIGGAGVTFTQGSTGTSTLAGMNTYTGGTTLNSGTLVVNGSTVDGTGTPLGSGTFTINGGTVATTIEPTNPPDPMNPTGTIINNPISVNGNFSVAPNVDAGNPGEQNITLNGPINLNGGTRTITGLVTGGQVHFGGGISNGGVNFNTSFTATGDYVAFIMSSGNVNTYTGLTTVNNGAFVVFEGATADGGIKGDVDIEGNGVVDYLQGNPAQIADTATVTVNSGGNFAGGTFFGGLDLYTSTGDTIGTLNGSSSGVVSLGAANLTIGAGDFEGLIFDGEHSGFFGGQITKIGPGTLFLSGQNFYTGGTTIDAGILQINSDQSLGDPSGALTFNGGTLEVVPSSVVQGSRTVNVNAAATMQIDASSVAEFDGVVSGAGSLTKTGSGELIFGGSNTVTGGTILNAGTLAVTSTGSLTAATAVLVNNPTGVTTLINMGTITGTTASVNALNSAGVTIGDFGTFTGAVQLGTGTNTVIIGTQTPYTPISGGAGNNDTLRLAGSASDTLRLTDFPGYEFLDKVGGGMWTLTGSNPFSGGTTVSGGTLNVRGTLISNTVVESMGTLSGTGLVNGNVTNFGIVMPGTPSSVLSPIITPGTLSVKGSYSQGSAGGLVIQINGTGVGQYSRLSIGGHAQLNGALVLQNGSGTGLKFGQQVTFLTASGGVGGTFSDVTNPFATGSLIIGKVIYEPDAVVLEGVQGTLLALDSQLHYTYNQKAVATALDNAASDPRLAKVLNYLDSRSIDKLPGELDQIAPEEMASVFRIGVSLSDVQARNVQRRTADLREGASGFSAAGFQTTGGPNYSGGLAGPNGTDGKTTNAPPDQRWGTFITGVGDFAHVGDSGNAEGYDLNTGGFTVGADYRLTDHLAAGVTVGYAGTNANLANDGRLLVNGGKVGAYGTYYTGGFHTDAALTGGYNNYSTRRSALQGDALGSTEGGEVDVMADAGYDWKLDALTIGPTASFQYTYVGIDSFTERSSLAPLHYDGQHQSSIRSTFGLRMAYEWKVGNVIVRPEGEISWQHEYGDRSYSIDSTFASGAGSMFSVADTQIGRDSFLFGGGVSVLWNQRTSTYLYYDSDLLKKEYYSQSVTGGLRLNF